MQSSVTEISTALSILMLQGFGYMAYCTKTHVHIIPSLLYNWRRDSFYKEWKLLSSVKMKNSYDQASFTEVIKK